MVRAIDAARIVDGIGEYPPPATGEFDSAQLGQTQIATFTDYLAAQLIAVDTYCIVGAVTDLGVVFPPCLDVGADTTIP